jgi:hypothetical protein
MKKAVGDNLCAEVVVVSGKLFLSFYATCNTLKPYWCNILEPWWCKLEQHWLMMSIKTVMLCFDIHHKQDQETSVHKWSTQPSAIQHPTAELRHSLLDNK